MLQTDLIAPIPELLADYGVAANDTVAIMLPNSVEWVEACFAITRAGAITETSTMVTMNWPSGGRTLGSCGLPVPGLAVRIVDPARE